VRRIVEKSFVVRAPLEVTWKHLAEVEKWPSWAKHIRSVVKSPPGPLGPSTCGTLKLANGAKVTFQMIEFEPPRHWKWVGPFLGSQVFYDHIFAEDKPGETTVRFRADIAGWTAAVLGRLFGSLYKRNLDRAVPLLIEEIETSYALHRGSATEK
jgi:hypothetical protein